MTGPPVIVASLWHQTNRLSELAPLHSLVWLALLTALGTAADLSLRDDDWSRLLNLAASCTVTVAQYSVTRALVARALPGGSGSAGFFLFFLLSIVTTLGVGLGLIALVLPGLFLMVRWSACVPAMLSEDLSIGAALRTSWRQTAGREWPILLMFLSIWVPAIVLMVAGLLIERSAPSFAGFVLFNLFLNAALMFGWHAAVAIFLSTRYDARVEEVFA